MEPKTLQPTPTLTKANHRLAGFRLVSNGMIVRVNRGAKHRYPDHCESVEHPQHEYTGPDEYDLADLELRVFGRQHDDGVESGLYIYEQLLKNDLLKRCLNLQDAYVIQKLGIEPFRKYLGGKMIYFWKSVVRNTDGTLCVPALYEKDGEVHRRYSWLTNKWDARCHALLFSR